MSKSHLINANIHRAKEGARVLEDIARFLLRDEMLFREMREIRHRISISAPRYDTKEDLGGMDLIEDNVRFNIIHIIQANALRLQEALRVLEEMESISLNKHLIKQTRHQVYHLHAKLYYAANKYLKCLSLEGLYLIIDTDVIAYSIEEIVAIINQSPVTIVQYRNKSESKLNILKKADKIKHLLDRNKLLIINDHVDIALDLGDGIHLGQNDYPLDRIRNIIPEDFILGISCHSLKEARIAVQCDASYIAIGCLFETKSKADVIPVSLEELQKVCRDVQIPVCAIGGIHLDNLEQVLSADIKMAALISFVWKTDDPLKAINDMHKKIKRGDIF